MDSKAKIFFEVSWIFKDGRSSTDGFPSRQFGVDIFQDTLDYLPQIDDGDRIHLYSTFLNAFKEECPEFNEEEYRLVYKGIFSPFRILCKLYKTFYTIIHRCRRQP